MIRVGLTGGIGCGKSTVAAMFRELGAHVVDADALVHEMLARGGEAVEAVLAVFPEAASADGRAVDRRRLGAIVFADPARRRELERIVHPLVWKRSAELTEVARAAGADVVVTEAAVLFEAARGGGPTPRDRFDALVVVTCDADAQIARVLSRLPKDATPDQRARAEADARARIAAQMPQAEKVALADYTIDNSGSVDATRKAVEGLLSSLAAK